MHLYTLEQFRTTTETGGMLSVSIIAQGGTFHIVGETRRGNASLIKTRGKEPREFRDATRALALLRELGIREAKVDTRNWRPEQADLGKAARPDRKAVMREAHEAADIKRTLEARIKEADDPNTVWHDAEDVFAEIEANLAR
jgi:hypothetical protein